MKRLTYLMSGLVLAAALALPAETLAQARPSGGGQSGGSGGGQSGGSGGARTPSSGGGGGGGQAVSRGSSGGGSTSSGGGSSATAPTPSGGSSGGAVSRPSGSRSPGRDIRSLGAGEQRGEAVPRGSRPNTGNPAVGRAVPREGRPPAVGGGGGGSYWPGSSYYGGYYGYPYGGYGSYWGLGAYSFYNPFYWGYGYPYYASPLWDTWGTIYPGYYGGSVYAAPSGGATGDLKLKVKPREAEVYVDGYFAGQVDNFDGVFQKLKVEPGTHRVEIRAEGYEPVTFEVRIIPGESITYKGELKRIN